MRAMVERALSSYEGVTKQAEATEEDDLVGPGALARLKDNSRKFSVLEQSRRQQEERYDGETRVDRVFRSLIVQPLLREICLPGVRTVKRAVSGSGAQYPLLLTWINFNPSMDK